MELIIADTNIILYALKGLPQIQPYLIYDFAVSDITIIECLGVKDIPNEVLQFRKEFLENIYNYPLTSAIKNIVIKLKQQYTLKIADAIIAATAIHYDKTLLTADKDFKRIKELSYLLISIV